MITRKIFEFMAESLHKYRCTKAGTITRQNGSVVSDKDYCVILNMSGQKMRLPIRYVVAYKARMLKNINFKNTEVIVLDENEPITKYNIKVCTIKEFEDFKKSKNLYKNKRMDLKKRLINAVQNKRKITPSIRENINKLNRKNINIPIKEVMKITKLSSKEIENIYNDSYTLDFWSKCDIVDKIDENTLENLYNFYIEGMGIEEIQDLFNIKHSSVVKDICDGELWSFPDEEEYINSLKEMFGVSD